ncbi:MAG: DNA-3-methyladenine glycosylase [Myxococcaceae bacterium]
MRLPREFYDRSTLTVARELLGKVLVLDEGGHRRAGRIVETEAYIGEHDLACHAARGRTARTEVLFGPPGIAYVYLIYGIYNCFNAVTRAEGLASAVLVRALEPLEGFDAHARTNGPGKLCRAMGITREHNRLDLLGDRLFIEHAPHVPARDIARGPRIGVDYAGPWAEKPYRFWIRDNPHVSRKPPRRPAPVR